MLCYLYLYTMLSASHIVTLSGFHSQLGYTHYIHHLYREMPGWVIFSSIIFSNPRLLWGDMVSISIWRKGCSLVVKHLESNPYWHNYLVGGHNWSAPYMDTAVLTAEWVHTFSPALYVYSSFCNKHVSSVVICRKILTHICCRKVG